MKVLLIKTNDLPTREEWVEMAHIPTKGDKIFIGGGMFDVYYIVYFPKGGKSHTDKTFKSVKEPFVVVTLG